MLSLAVVEEIAHHLAAGELSQREIARRLGVGRTTVSAIAREKRGLYGRNEESPTEPETLALPKRCPKCGYLVYLPCLVCRTREYSRGRRILDTLSNGRPAPPHGAQPRPKRRRRRCWTRISGNGARPAHDTV